jgi:excisionase family DNA binding protein
MRVPASANGRSHVEQVLAELDHRQTLQLLAWVQHRQDHLATVRTLLEGRLTTLTAGPGAQPTTERYLTVDEVCRVLRLKRARVYELVRSKALPKLAGLGTQVRIPASALNGHGQREKATT